MNDIHANFVLKMGVILLSTRIFSVTEIGMSLNKLHSDELTSGGYWLYDWDTKDCYLSDKLIESIGYSRSDVAPSIDFFYKVANNEHLNLGFAMVNDLIDMQSESCFCNKLEYTHNDGHKIQIQCSGTVFYKYGKPVIVLGTHEIL